ncbi:hypothetical protein TNCV_375171, partial [Trichonephila clavipes]
VAAIRYISRSYLDPNDFTVLNCIVKGHASLSSPSLRLRFCSRFTLLAILAYFDPKDYIPHPIDNVKEVCNIEKPPINRVDHKESLNECSCLPLDERKVTLRSLKPTASAALHDSDGKGRRTGSPVSPLPSRPAHLTYAAGSNPLRGRADRRLRHRLTLHTTPSGIGIGTWLALSRVRAQYTKDPRVGQRCTLNLSRAETSSRWCGGAAQGRLCLSSPAIGSINEYKLSSGLKTEGLSSDRPPNRDICSCTSASNGHVYYDGHREKETPYLFQRGLIKRISTLSKKIAQGNLTASCKRLISWFLLFKATELGGKIFPVRPPKF